MKKTRSFDLLSHRLRGFDSVEGSLNGLDNAIAAGVDHIEVDIRQSKDGQFIMHHDPFLLVGKHLKKLEALTALELEEYGFLKLERFLVHFKKVCQPDTILYIDIKDGGREEHILSQLRAHSLLDQSVLVSWNPYVLLNASAIEPSVRLCFSFVPTDKSLFISMLAFALKSTFIIGLSKAIARVFSKRLSAEIGSLLVIDDPLEVPSQQASLLSDIGSTHVYFASKSLPNSIRKALQVTHGLVCIPRWSATGKTVANYQDMGIKVAVFSAKNKSDALGLAEKLQADIVFCDSFAES